jgi:hypothetical protein
MSDFYDDIQMIREKYGVVLAVYSKEDVALALEDKGYTVADAVAKAEVIWNDTLFTTAIQDHLNSPEAIGLADMVSDAIRELEVRDGDEAE